MGKRENKVETYLNEQVELIGGITRKWVSPGHSGVPDQIVIMTITVREMIIRLSHLNPDAVVADIYFPEVKTTDGIHDPGQEREHTRLRDAGANVTTVYGHAGVDEFIEWIK